MNVDIERLTLHAGAMSPADARRLAELVAVALGRLPEHPKSPDGPKDAARVDIDIAPRSGRGLPEIADAVAAAVAAALRIEAVS